MSLEAGRPLVRIHETSEEVFDTTMAVNTKSVFLGCKYATAQMLKQDLLPSGDRGWIVNMCSIYGLTGGYCMRESVSRTPQEHTDTMILTILEQRLIMRQRELWRS